MEPECYNGEKIYKNKLTYLTKKNIEKKNLQFNHKK